MIKYIALPNPKINMKQIYDAAEIVDNAFAGKDRIARLERLAALQDRGALTEKEFEQEKALILEPEE